MTSFQAESVATCRLLEACSRIPQVPDL